MFNELAGGGDLDSYAGPEQLFCGELPIHTGSGDATTTIAKYAVCKMTKATRAIAFVNDTTTDTGDAATYMYVIAAQPTANGKKCPYYDGGHFNANMLTWPANLDTLAERKAFFAGTNIDVSVPI